MTAETNHGSERTAEEEPVASVPVEARRGHLRRRWLNYLILGVLLAALYFWVDLGSVWETIRFMPPGALVIALLIATLDRFAMGYKWRQLIVDGGGVVRLWDTVSAYYQAAFSGRVMPITVGQDLFRAYLVQRKGVRWDLVAASMGIEKLVAIIANIGLALAGVLYLASRMSPETRGLLVAVTVFGLFAALAALALALFRPLHVAGGRLLRRWVPARIYKGMKRSSESVLAYRQRPLALLKNLALAIAEQWLILTKFYVLGVALGVTLPLFTFYAAIAAVMFARRITAYFEGWGLTEASSVIVFAMLGLSQDQAVALALVNYGVSTIALLPGAYLLYRSKLGLGEAMPMLARRGNGDDPSRDEIGFIGVGRKRYNQTKHSYARQGVPEGPE
jgi:glycosyltransferase 2 family protein